MFVQFLLATIMMTELAKIISKSDEELEEYRSEFDGDSAVEELPAFQRNLALLLQLHDWMKKIFADLYRDKDVDIRCDWLMNVVGWIDISPRVFLHKRYLKFLGKCADE